jgi:hypothetical protein
MNLPLLNVKPCRRSVAAVGGDARVRGRRDIAFEAAEVGEQRGAGAARPAQKVDGAVGSLGGGPQRDRRAQRAQV